MARAILVIDVQKVYTDPASPLHCVGNADAIANINRIVAAAEAAGDLVVHVRHVHRRDGSDAGRMFDFSGEAGELGFVAGTEEVEDDPRFEIPAGALTITKQRYSSFVGTGLEQMLRERSIDRIVVTGFMTNFCCEATARHGHDLDFFVDFPLDATGCPDLSETATQETIKAGTTATLAAGFARVMSTAEWLAGSGI
ncbi:nicotinamidase-related amidase [Sinorhizobium kostiense]|uniref:Nicotinamidase-related amidase n=1 Tax=Sinorhizobium kostiense TaxID=76747 RepID=A0ABS4QUM5_9HYPH|nr:isochorismatase family cysteine hydrolase [Sinorhizobium kostiense]MBP2234358.1 nicotinamidase-related amidase [Sinorhizobium kostiense]